MLDTLLNYISGQKLFQPEQKILLAVSGGIDSMVMEHLFRQARFMYAIAHCNFKLRDKDSDEDQLWIQKFASEHEIPFFTTSFETAEYASKQHISIQMAARDLRRNWFDDLLKIEDFELVATAHHLNDSIETVIFNLAKGTGISGVKGITPRNEPYIRPLMFATRTMIMDYARNHKISWREDRSNSSTKYSRNLIRHKIIPELKKINPRLEQTFSQTAEKLAATERIYHTVIDQLKRTLLVKSAQGFKIAKSKLMSINESKLVLHELLEDFGFNYHQVTDILRSMEGQSGKLFLAEQYQLIIDREHLLISEKNIEGGQIISITENQETVLTGSGRLSFEKIERSKVSFIDDNNTAFIDFDKIQFPLTMRNWEAGDHFQPLGMKHKKKLSDFMIDEKIPLNLKKQVPLLISNNDIVWVVGYRIDDRFKITEQTVNAYKICNMLNND